jgi:hypothetical protein
MCELLGESGSQSRKNSGLLRSSKSPYEPEQLPSKITTSTPPEIGSFHASPAFVNTDSKPSSSSDRPPRISNLPL